MQIRKRDGRLKDYNVDRIAIAIEKAYEDVYKESKSDDFKKFLVLTVQQVEINLDALNKEVVDIEKVQDIVVKAIKQRDKKVAKSYSDYRKERTKNREANGYISKEIDAIFNQTSEEIRNNANKAGDKIQCLRAMISDITCKHHARTKGFPQHLLDRHEKTLYIHDLNYASLPLFNCCLINWIDMLDNGFEIAGQQIETPKSITTAVALLSQIVSHVSSNCYGGVTLPQLSHLAKYAKKSYEKHVDVGRRWIKNEDEVKAYAMERLEKEVKDAAQGFEYEIQTLTNARAETPFLTIELDYGAEEFGTFEHELEKMVISAFLNMRKGGLTNGVVATFPKIVFKLKEGVNLNKEDRDYDMFRLACETSSVALYPDYLNEDTMVNVTGGYKPPMSCRSFLSEWIDEYGNRKTLGRWNNGVCSINLPRLAIMANKDEDKFFKLLDDELNYAKEVLLIRLSKLKGVKAKQAPILYMSGAMCRLDQEQTIDHLLYGGYSTISIGYIGLHNTMVSLYGKSYYESDEMMKKAEKIMNTMSDFCKQAKKETDLGFSLYSTPFEIGATKLCKQDTLDFGIIEGVTDNGYYENSFHFPSDKEINPFDKIMLESNFSKIATGGAIQYVECSNMIHNVDALEDIIRYSYDKTHYFAVNVSADKCFKCGYRGEILSTNETETEYQCPQCGNTDKKTMSVVRRLCGYLSALNERSTVDNKLKEINHRVKHITSCGDR